MLTEKKTNSKYFYLSGLIGLINLLTYSNFYLSFLLFCAEIVFLLIKFLKRKYSEFIFLYLIFLTMSFEFADETDTAMYGFKTFEIGGICVCFFLLIPLFFKAIRIISFNSMNSECSFTKDILVMGIFGILNGVFSILINDNQVSRFDSLFSLFLGEVFYKFVVIIVLCLIFVYLKNRDEDFVSNLYDVLSCILVGGVITIAMSSLLNIVGSYGGTSTLKIQYVVRYIPFLYVLSAIKKERKSRVFYFIIATIGTIYTLYNNASGKMIIMYAIMPVVVIAVNMKHDKLLAIFELFIILFGFLFAYNYVISSLSNNILFASKLREVTSLFNFGNGWLQNMSVSPRVRFAEFIDISIEYLQHPFRLLTGKGYLGTTVDHIGLIANVLGGYSQEQDNLNTFYAMHESLNTVFLINGLLGIYFLIKYTIKLTRGLLNSPFNYCALFWLWFAYGFSFTLTAFGVFSLLLSLSEDDSRKKKRCDYENLHDNLS